MRVQHFKIALGIVLLQILLALILAPKNKLPFLGGDAPPDWTLSSEAATWPERAYLRLNNWDSFHFFDIARHGYLMPNHAVTTADVHEFRANPVFFPAFPFTARFVSKILGISLPLSLLLTAESFALLFWFYFLTLLTFLGIPSRWQVLAVFSLLIHPAAFYLVAGYSESIFIASTLAMIYGCLKYFARPNFVHFTLAALGGFTMGSSRIVGVSMFAFPFVLSLQKKKQHLAGAVLSLITLAGTVLFFAYTQIRFGDWKLYFKLQSIGWGNSTNYFAIFKPWLYLPRFFREDTLDSLDRGATLFLILLLIYALRKDFMPKLKAAFEKRGALYYLALSLLFISVSGKGNSELSGMVRYSFPIFALSLIPLLQLIQEKPEILSKWQNLKSKLLIASLCLVSFGGQLYLTVRFLRGRWVS